MPKANPTKSAISTFQLFERFPDQESARLYLESRLWPNGVVCPICGLGERITARKAGYYRCNQCAEDFTVRTGTVMERSHIPLHMSLDEAHMATLAELRADIIRSAAAGQGPTFIAAKLDILIAKAVAPECRCDCVNCVTGNHSGCYYKPSVCPMKFSKRDVQP
jgi:transposase-like protein